MLEAYGWVVVRSSRAPYARTGLADLDAVDDQVTAADTTLFRRLEEFLREHSPPDLDWSFRPEMNNVRGVLTVSSSRNHRGDRPTVVRLLDWLAENGPGSYGLIYVHDDEDCARVRSADGPVDLTNAFRVWRLLDDRVEELDDPFLSPIVPRINPTEFA